MTDLKDKATQMAGELGNLLKGGGAASILSKLSASGLGDIASSWIGKGKNLPIPPDILAKVLGNDTIASIAAKLGIAPESASKSLADMLPHAIDHMTPDGTAPADDAAMPDPVALTAKLFGGA